MHDCKGIFGKIFGHQFEKFMIKEPTNAYNFQDASFTNETMKTLVENNFIVYEIRCKRCGCKPDDAQCTIPIPGK